MRLLFILLISVSVLAKLEYRNKKTLNPKLVRKSFVESKALKIIKKGNKSCFYQNDEQSYNEKKKAILKAISNLFQGPIKVEEIKNLDLNTLTVKIYDPEELYEINKAYVKYDYIFSKKEKIKIQKKLYSHVIDLDISKLSLGEHKAYFIFKIKSKKKKRWKRKSHYVFSNLDFVKTDIPNIISNLVVEPLENTPYVKLDASNSSSDGADIVSYEFITLKDGVQVDSLLSETPVVYIDFDDVGTYELQLKVTTADGFSELSDKLFTLLQKLSQL